MLLQHGASVAARGFDGRTALHEAASSGSRAVTETLLQPQYNAGVNAVDEDGQTPLLTAIDADPWNAQVVEALLLADADINPSNAPGSEALNLAAHSLSIEVINCIMQHRDEQLTAQTLAMAAVVATEAEIDSDQDRVQQLEVVIRLLGAAMQKDAAAATTALFEALDGTDDYASNTILRASMRAWMQAASRVADLESQYIAVQQWMVLVAQDHLRLIAREQQIQARMQLNAQREQQLLQREQQVAARKRRVAVREQLAAQQQQ